MKVLHLTEKKNIKSIFKIGLVPSPIKLTNHLDAFKECGAKNDKFIYFWDNNYGALSEKYIKDLIYAKLFIHPRNDIIDYLFEKENTFPNFLDYGKKIYGNDNRYYLMEVELEESYILGNQSFVHSQTSSDDNYCTNRLFDDTYAHDDKILYVTENIITPDNIEIKSEIRTRVYKNNDIRFSFSRI